jgi:hypothetical protein
MGLTVANEQIPALGRSKPPRAAVVAAAAAKALARPLF